MTIVASTKSISLNFFTLRLLAITIAKVRRVLVECSGFVRLIIWEQH